MSNPKNYNFKFYTSIARAMNNHNKIMPTPRFTILDVSILCLIKSFYESKTKFYMSNKELGEIMIADPSTIQRSIDRLIAVGLVKKEIIYVGPKPQRFLTYAEDAVNSLFKLNWIAYWVVHWIVQSNWIIIINNNNKLNTRNTTYYSY